MKKPLKKPRKHEQQLQQVGRTVKRLREERKLSQEALADRARIHSVMVSRVERGDTDARVSTLISIAGGLDVPPAELLRDAGASEVDEP